MQVTAEVTGVTADGEVLSFVEPNVVEVERTWSSFEIATHAEPIELLFLQGDQSVHHGRARAGACKYVLAPCSGDDILEENISITDWGYRGPLGGYLDFGPGYYTDIACSGCGIIILGSP